MGISLARSLIFGLADDDMYEEATPAPKSRLAAHVSTFEERTRGNTSYVSKAGTFSERQKERIQQERVSQPVTEPQTNRRAETWQKGEESMAKKSEKSRVNANNNNRSATTYKEQKKKEKTVFQ